MPPFKFSVLLDANPSFMLYQVIGLVSSNNYGTSCLSLVLFSQSHICNTIEDLAQILLILNNQLTKRDFPGELTCKAYM